ncbi:MAG: response regulator [Magnetococcales bacterium]|nr:response regulator [Magnetococcales bacterium]NGZ26435.1 response regulator [Magnetococcales bacterium]
MNGKESSNQEDSFVTTREAGQLLGISQRTVHYWLEKGILRSWKTEGGHSRIPMGEIHKLLAKRRESLDDNPKAIQLLLVEDDDILVELFRAAVAKWPFPVRVITAANGYDGLIQAGLHKPDILVTDLAMPAMDGFQMIRQLRETAALKKCRTVVVTALSAQQIAEHGGLPAEVILFEKPVAFKKIKAIAQQMIHHPLVGRREKRNKQS